MIKFENTEVMGWEHAIRGARNPLNSWNRSDTVSCDDMETCAECPHVDDRGKCDFKPYVTIPPIIGPNDYDLMKRLRNAGTDHRKFMRMITVYVDITAPLYWWKEFDTYKVGTVANSCSTMHKIADKEFTVDDFSHEHLFAADDIDGMYYSQTSEEEFTSTDVLKVIIEALNNYRELYISCPDELAPEKKVYWWQMIQLLPSSYNQRRTVMLNFEVLANMYKSRKAHKLNEWRDLCAWIETLPYHELITGKFGKGEVND